MSVYKRTYHPFTGTLTGQRTRFSVLMRYAFADVWSSRITNVLTVICFIPALISLAIIYIMNNDAVRLLISGAANGNGPPPIAMDARYFFYVMQVQCWMALALTAWVGPRLIAIDMSNNALPIILSHPISRLEYALAKFTLLAAFLSAVTWVPTLLLFALQSYLSAVPWAGKNIAVAYGTLVGSLLWIAVISLVALAVSCWVKWRIVATGMVFAAMFVPAGMGTVFNVVLRTDWGSLANIQFMMFTLWRRMMQVQLPAFYSRHELPTMAILISLATVCAGCIAALNARIRAREVVRG